MPRKGEENGQIFDACRMEGRGIIALFVWLKNNFLEAQQQHNSVKTSANGCSADEQKHDAEMKQMKEEILKLGNDNAHLQAQIRQINFNSNV